MSDQLDEPHIKKMPIANLTTEPGAEDLLDSPAMEPYISLALAIESGQDRNAAVSEIAALPLESRYTWRVASAFKWAFADFDTVPVVADRKTMDADDRNKQRQMEALMVSAIKQAREVVKFSQCED